jgi:Zn ribbon nucleic-acid-binding protein
MKCPKCDYEDIIFEPPANVYCPECGFKYEYDPKAIKKRTRNLHR